jgi:xanthine dehydrogenase YagR molybdenum-binding subunit
LDIVTWLNAPPLCLLEANPNNRPGQTYLVLQEDAVLYQGQYIAIVTAETFEQARYASSRLEITYSKEPAVTDLRVAADNVFKPERITVIDAPAVDSDRGNTEAAFNASPVRLELEYTSPIENHNAMEPHATIAQWFGDHLLLIDSTQWVDGTRNMVATHLGLPSQNVRVLSPFIGGGFGSKGNPWPHPTLAAIAARRVGRPVKLVLARQQMFSQVGHRPATIQRFHIGATSDGRLNSISHDVISGTSRFDDYVESAAATARVAYSCPNVATTHRLAHLDLNTPCPMRAPGEALGNFVTESGMDELAYAVGLDPLELRLRNYAEIDEDRGKPFSSKALRACYLEAAERFGWKKRPQPVRSMRSGNLLLGWGMASAVFTVKLSPASARVQLRADGTATVFTASHDIGTGTYTSLAALAASELRISPLRVEVKLGDTDLPSAPASAGSQTSGSVGSAVVLAARKAMQSIKDRAGKMDSTLHWSDLLKLPGQSMVEAEAQWEPTRMDKRTWSAYSFGAHFCQVAVDECLGKVSVQRWVAAFAAGRILNEKTARSQLIGGIVWGIGQALLEETVRDGRGRLVNANLSDYLVPVNADVPSLEVSLLAEEDSEVNPAGAKGLGELGICGAGAAIANAIFHATGHRFRDLPFKTELWFA